MRSLRMTGSPPKIHWTTRSRRRSSSMLGAQGLSLLRGSPRNDCCKPPEKHRLLVPSNLAQHGWPAAVSFRRLLQIARTGPGLNRAGRASAGRLQVGRPEKPRSCTARLRSGSVVRTVPANGLVVRPHPRPLRGIESTTGEGVAAESWSAGIAWGNLPQYGWPAECRAEGSCQQSGTKHTSAAAMIHFGRSAVSAEQIQDLRFYGLSKKMTKTIINRAVSPQYLSHYAVCDSLVLISWSLCESHK